MLLKLTRLQPLILPLILFIENLRPKIPSRLQYHALLIYQKLIAFHLKDAKPDALIDADLQRIEFVKNKSVHPDKDKLYFNAINHIAHQYGKPSGCSAGLVPGSQLL